AATLGQIDWLPALMEIPGVMGAHILDGDNALGQQPTAEKKFRESRGDLDRTVATAILVDAYDLRAAETALRNMVDHLAGATAQAPIATLYQTQHVIVADDTH